MKSVFLQAAYNVFKRERRPLTAKELTRLALASGDLPDTLNGKTYDQSMKARISVHIRRFAETSPFVRIAPGRFFLRELLSSADLIYHALPFEPSSPNEQVACVPFAWIQGWRQFQGISEDHQMFFRDVHRNGVLTFQDRMKAEADDGLKQLVCYVMVTRRKEVLAFRRGIHNRADAMLRGALCIGFGGHVRKQDFNLFSGETLGCLDAASREIEEELKLPEQDLARLKSHVGLQMMGLLNDDSSSIGRRHLAVVMKYEVGDDEAWSQPLRGERSVNQLHWISVEAAKLNLKDFEYWSQLCLSHFYEPMVEAQPSYAIRRKAPFRPPHILCVVGAIGSGKTETTAVLRNDLDYIEVNSGRVLAGLIEEVLTDEARREPFQKKANEFIRQDQGPAQLARAIMEAVNATGSDRVLVDGIRHRSTLDALRNAAGRRRVGVLYVHTPPNIAYRFYRQRSGSSTFLDFLRVREAEVEREVESLIADADAVLYNWTGKDIYRATVTRLMMDAWGEVNASH